VFFTTVIPDPPRNVDFSGTYAEKISLLSK